MKTKQYCYPVYFLTGEYDDSITELVKVFLKEEDAKAFVAKKNNQLIKDELSMLHGYKVNEDYRYRDKARFVKKYGFHIDYNGAMFKVGQMVEML